MVSRLNILQSWNVLYGRCYTDIAFSIESFYTWSQWKLYVMPTLLVIYFRNDSWCEFWSTVCKVTYKDYAFILCCAYSSTKPVIFFSQEFMLDVVCMKVNLHFSSKFVRKNYSLLNFDILALFACVKLLPGSVCLL